MKKKYTRQRIERITEMIKNEDRPIKEICALSDISTTTYYAWKKKKEYFENAITRASLVTDEKGISFLRIKRRKSSKTAPI
jgi:transposase-like protein